MNAPRERGRRPSLVATALLGCALALGSAAGQAQGMAEGGREAPHVEAPAEKARTLQGVDEDARLEALIERRLAWDRELAPYDLDVEVNNAVATLTGSVATIPESHRARRIADDTEGVLGVVNALLVDTALVPFAGERIEAPDDEALRGRIAEALAGDNQVVAEGIEVRVEDGHVVLSGEVSGVAQKSRAGRIARSLYGVRSLENEIRAAPRP